MILCVFILPMLQLALSESVTWFGVMLEPEGHCTAEWYEPLGDSDVNFRESSVKFKTRNGTTIQQNTKSIAEQEANVLAAIAKRSGVEVRSSVSLSNIMNIDTAPELVVGLILHARVYDKSIKENTFSIQSLSTVFGDLKRSWSLETNKAIYRMERFVNHDVIQDCRGSLEDILEPLQNSFASCIRHTNENEEKVLSCLEEVESLAKLFESHFLPYLEEMHNNIDAVTNEMLKKIECGMVNFRNYANLRLKLYFILLATYRKFEGENIRRRYFHFLQELPKSLDLFLKYSRYMEQTIKNTYNHEHSGILQPEHCKKLRSNSGKALECVYHFCEILHTDSVCRITVAVSPINFTNTDNQELFLSKYKGPYEAAKEFSILKANLLYELHKAELSKAVESRWNRKMTPILKTWQEIKLGIQKIASASYKHSKDCTYKLKPAQTKNVNDLKKGIDDLRSKRNKENTVKTFVKEHSRDEL